MLQKKIDKRNILPHLYFTEKTYIFKMVSVTFSHQLLK